jgi:hypothetical protein
MSTDLTTGATEVYGDLKHPVNGEPRDAGVLASLFAQPAASALLWLRRRLEEVIGSFLPVGGLLPLTLSVASSTFTLAGHGLSANDPVRLWSVGGSVPPPLAQFVTYYVVGGSLTSNTFQLSATVSGSAITLSGVGSGAIYAAKQGASSLSALVAGYVTLAALAAQTSPPGDNLVGGEALTGTGFDLAAGTLESRLQSIANQAAALAGAAFTGNISTSGSLGVGSNATVGGNLSVAKHFSNDHVNVSASATTYTYDAATMPSRVIADAWNGGGGALVVTLANYGGTDHPEVEFFWYPTGATFGTGKTLTVQRASAVSMVVLLCAGSVKFRWDGASWREGSGQAFDNDPTHILWGTVY